MTALIASVAVSLFAAGTVTGILAVATLAIHREKNRRILASHATGTLAQAGRWLNGVYVSRPSSADTGGPQRGRRQ